MKPLSDSSLFLAPSALVIHRLKAQGCRSDDWSSVRLHPQTDPSRLIRVNFADKVFIDRISAEGGGWIEDVFLKSVWLGAEVVIRRVHRLEGMRVEGAAVVEDCGVLECRRGAVFGSGVEVRAGHETAGRVVRLHADLALQEAWLSAFLPGRKRLADRLRRRAAERSRMVARTPGRIGAGARLVGVRRLVDVQVGEGASIEGASDLENGTVDARPGASVQVRGAVQARQRAWHAPTLHSSAGAAAAAA